MNIKYLKPNNIKIISRILLDRLFGLDFLKTVLSEDVGLNPEKVHRSSPSGNVYLKELLKDFKIDTQDSIIDIGCGKGSAMRTMIQFPFQKVDGIELSDVIAKIAERNFSILKVKKATIFVGDAAEFKSYEDYNMIYFYNPFPNSVMTDVVKALIASLEVKKRELIIIYNNPICHDIIVNNNVFKKIGTYPDIWGNGIGIYSNYDLSHSRLLKNKKILLDPSN
ncbi:class I SAM-dependent methyltransferase [Flavobacterium sp.]|uniref:class I SAM-dependent methyltransferase n=1 Tax=Flavobacterium sp. TaxID=239 RepID=UPI002612A665|nr:class I SAM-dependent methyltransferase [Flavobacterium sp.]